MTTNYFEYNKAKVIQALRYHFISRKEIKIMMILVNVFALLSASLFFMKKITPVAFLLSSFLWFLMMILFWFLLPRIIYRKSPSFKEKYRIKIDDNAFTVESERGSRSFNWQDFFSWMESPHFFHVYFNATSFFLIPKEAFKEDFEHDARNYFKEKIKK
jgi:uncharacterized membrane protein